MSHEKPISAHVEDLADPHLSESDAHILRRAQDVEVSMTVRQAFRKYPGAIAWSAAMTLSIVMEGYDTGLISSFFAYPSFVEKYGVYYAEINKKQIPAEWMLGLNNAISCGQLIGLVLNGWAMERFGHRRTMIFALVPLMGFIGLQFASPNLPILLLSEILISIPWGVFTVMGTAYSSELCPTAVRGYLTSLTCVAWVIGQMICAGVLVGLVNLGNEWSYRIPFALQWVWPIPLIAIAYYAPESHWWLVRRGRLEEARQTLRRITSKHVSEDELDGVLATLVHTNDYEKRQGKTESSYLDCFKGVHRRRTEIACLMLISQSWCGERFAYNPTYFFSQAGLNSNAVYQLNLGSTAISFCCIGLAWFLMSYMGRRYMVIGGLFGMSACLLIIGCLATMEKGTSTWIQAAFAMIWIAFYGVSIGPMAYTIVGEISSTRTRNHTFALARIAYSCINISSKVIEPYLINPTKLNLAGKTAFFWFGTNTIILLWAIFRLPETKGRSNQELDILFDRKVSAWAFRTTKVDIIAEATEPEGMEGEDAYADKDGEALGMEERPAMPELKH
ncbi:general substrate transporter [Dioszegia hungarica]|uniref:General substrate transporter n=1 Tax=Dioszegia hungarica TaxID=4972 RepID=A0AA38LRT6_9TREE|nr:general substrate transporter [Dioszegia hungarica]KAI9633555.1 general substrate transporter [Dioszegia hungarica]